MIAFIKTASLPVCRIPIKGMKKDEYLKLQVMEGAKRRYGSPLPTAVVERAEQELRLISWYGLENYFLVCHEIIQAAKDELGVLVGPGRGSAAGSIVNYCLGITDIDPLKYGLLFERFLLCSRPQNQPYLYAAGLDFDEKGRDEIVKWVEQKYADRVAHLGTYSLDPFDAGIHPSGLVFFRKSCTKLLSLALDNQNRVCTTLDGAMAGEAGLMTLDFLPMPELSIIKDVLQQCNLHINDIPLDDALTMQSFQAGDTGKIMMFDSRRMRKYLRAFHPDNLLDLTALNALHPRGPQLVASMIARKSNPQSIHYILPCLAATLKETYGILVYQEQVMQIAKDIAHFTPAQADELRTAICRASTTREAQLKALKPIFINQATENGHDRNDVLQLWQWLCDQGFSAFNKSHTLCYTLIAYQMAYLKTHHPTQYHRAYSRHNEG